MLVDSHCHLDFPGLAERLPEVFSAMKTHGVGAAACICVTLENFPRVRALAEAHENLYATLGVHPEYEITEEPGVEALARLADHPKVIAIGETGLDYHWHKNKPEWQRQRFRTHIRAARACGKPLVVHMRDASEDTLRILEEENATEVGGVMHCFTGTREVARQALQLGFYLSFSGIVTFKNAAEIKAVAQEAPIDRILLETDAPYLAPDPHRGQTNQPAYLRYIAKTVAQLRNQTPEAIARATTDNFYRLFNTARRPESP